MARFEDASTEREVAECTGRARRLCALARRCALGFALLLPLVEQAFFTSYRISGASMSPSFRDGDRVVVAELPGLFGAPRRGEAVIARVDGEVLIKRVAGVPGDLVAAAGGPRCRLGAGEYYLLGDHRRVSIDSREFGPVRAESLLARVILRVPGATPGTGAGARARPR